MRNSKELASDHDDEEKFKYFRHIQTRGRQIAVRATSWKKP
jgi:hypothetical protein